MAAPDRRLGSLSIRIRIFLSAFFYRVTLLHPIGREIVRQKQHAQIRKAQIAKRVESRTNIRAAIERTAAAVNDHFRVARETLRPSFQIGKSLLRLRRAMKHRTRHVSAHIERAKTGAHHNRLRAAF